jgi:chromosome segregation ATPase
MLAFAVDRGIAVAREKQRRQTATSAKIARGVMTVTVLDRQTTTYRIRAAGPRAHHPARASAAGRLAAGDARGRRVELARDVWRIPVTIGAGGTAAMPVTTERPRQQVVRLENARDAEIGVYVGAAEIDPAVRDALKRLVELREALAALTQRVKAIEQERTAATQEQERIRANLQAVPARDAMHTRFLNALKAQEDRLDRLAGELESARTAERAARDGLAGYVAGLELYRFAPFRAP